MHRIIPGLTVTMGIIVGTAGCGFGSHPAASAGTPVTRMSGPSPSVPASRASAGVSPSPTTASSPGHPAQPTGSGTSSQTAPFLLHDSLATTATWQWLSLRTKAGSPSLIAAISPSGHQLTIWVATYIGMYDAHPKISRIAWNLTSHALGQTHAALAAPSPASSPAYQLISESPDKAKPVLMHGTSRAPIAWPAAVPTYMSGINPATTPFRLDNRVIGQSGQWLWVALKGPANDPVALRSVWGFRHWNRLVALNVRSGQYRLFALPRAQSEVLTGPLWYAPPTFAANQNWVYIGIGSWLGRFPANPLSVNAVKVYGGPPAHLTQERRKRALSILTNASWKSVDADAAFWNCYVMNDPNTKACAPGVRYPNSPALSQQFTYFNHGSIPVTLQWATQLPLSAAENRVRTADIARLKASLKASLLMRWVASPSPAALRKDYPHGPPYPLPGYYRKDGLYWANGS
ncbi:MAG: hypothetical protein M0Z36_06305 [Thermaerobacter sp.]|nr:hypothetical protein [Thermaerobacter sp.]